MVQLRKMALVDPDLLEALMAGVCPRVRQRPTRVGKKGKKKKKRTSNRQRQHHPMAKPDAGISFGLVPDRVASSTTYPSSRASVLNTEMNTLLRPHGQQVRGTKKRNSSATAPTAHQRRALYNKRLAEYAVIAGRTRPSPRITEGPSKPSSSKEVNNSASKNYLVEDVSELAKHLPPFEKINAPAVEIHWTLTDFFDQSMDVKSF